MSNSFIWPIDRTLSGATWNLLTDCNQSHLPHLPRQYTGSLSPILKQQNATTTTMLRVLLLYQFWLAEIWICHKPCPTRDETRDPQIALLRTLMLPFFSILPALHTQDTFMLVLNFEVGHFTHHFLLLSFFLLVSLWKKFNPHSFVVTFRFSC